MPRLHPAIWRHPNAFVRRSMLRLYLNSGSLRHLDQLAWRDSLLSLQPLAFDFQELRVQFGANQNRNAAHVEPEEQGNDRADSSVSLVVVGEVRHIDVDGRRNQYPQHRSRERSWQSVLEALLHVGSKKVQHLHRENNAKSNDSPAEEGPTPFEHI